MVFGSRHWRIFLGYFPLFFSSSIEWPAFTQKIYKNSYLQLLSTCVTLLNSTKMINPLFLLFYARGAFSSTHILPGAPYLFIYIDKSNFVVLCAELLHNSETLLAVNSHICRAYYASDRDWHYYTMLIPLWCSTYVQSVVIWNGMLGLLKSF